MYGFLVDPQDMVSHSLPLIRKGHFRHRFGHGLLMEPVECQSLLWEEAGAGRRQSTLP